MFEDKKLRTNPYFIPMDVFLREHYPRVFTTYIPLKIGIHEDIILENPEIDQKLLNHYLFNHTRRTKYLKILSEHDFRYNLQGISVHQLTPDDKAYCLKKYQEQLKKLALITEAKKLADVNNTDLHRNPDIVQSPLPEG